MNKNTLAIFALISAIAVAITWQSCKKNNGNNRHFGCGGPMVGNEPTTVMLIFSNVNNPNDIDTAIWSNKDINNSVHPDIDNTYAHLTLSANSSYHVRVLFLNILVPNTDSGYDVTASVAKESNNYLVCFNDSMNFYGNLGAGLNWTREDYDISTPSPMQLGLIDSFWTGADSAAGLLQTTLHHQYKVKNGDCSPGYIDIQALDTVYISPGKGLVH